MNEVLLDVVADVLAVVAVSIGAAAFAAVGLLMEQAGLASLTAGAVAVGLWYVYMGGVALFVAVYLLGYQQLAPRIGALLAAVGQPSE